MPRANKPTLRQLRATIDAALALASNWEYTFKPALSWRSGQQRAIEHLRTAQAAGEQILQQTRSKRLAAWAMRVTIDARRSEQQQRNDIQGAVEWKAARHEDIDAWAESGWRVFDVWDTHTYNTQPDPWYCALCSARYASDVLTPMGVAWRVEYPDAHYVRWFDSYWGTHMSQQHGHHVLLVRADTPIELELIRRAYLDRQIADWRARHRMDFPHSGFRDWR